MKTINKTLKAIDKALNEGIITYNEYTDEINKLCDKYGTEYIANRMVALHLW